MSGATCDQRGWLAEDQDWDNPCTCGLSAGHDGLHECYEGCGGEWAGGLPAEVRSTDTTEAAVESLPAPCSDECGWCGENMPPTTNKTGEDQ